jgi:hypothetical protein
MIALGMGLDPDAEGKPDDQGRSHPTWQSYRQTARDALIAAEKIGAMKSALSRSASVL